jgi:tripartite-type tricarboxylate transporter receptor subunit TctC
MTLLHRCSQTLLMFALIVFGVGAPAQDFPNRAIRLIVADAPAGHRINLPACSRRSFRMAWVSRSSSTIAPAQVACSAPISLPRHRRWLHSVAHHDGDLRDPAQSAEGPALRSGQELRPISRIATASNVLVVNVAVPANSIAELVKLAKEKPGALNYASAGVGTPAHLAGEMLNLLAGIKVTHIPYKGAAPGLLDVIAGNAQYIITSPIAAGAHMKGGRVRALATTGAERNPSLPDLPTIGSTVPGYEISQTWGIVAPAGTSQEIVKRLSDAITATMNLPDVKDQVLKTGAVPVGDRPADFEAFMANERQRLGDVITRSGIVLTE